MSDYIRRNLGPNEKVIMEAKINRLCIVPNIIGIILGIVFFFVLDSGLSEVNNYAVSIGDAPMPEEVRLIMTGFIAAISAIIVIVNLAKILSVMNMCLVVTNKRVLGKVGVLSIKALDYPIEKVDNVSLSAGVFGNIFKYYKLSVKSAGSGGADPRTGAGAGINFIGVKNAIEFKNHVTIAIEKHSEEARKLQAEEIAKAMAKNQK